MTIDVAKPKKLMAWETESGIHATLDTLDFIAQVRRLKSVGYGAMQTLIEWIWQEDLENEGRPVDEALGAERYARDLKHLQDKIASLESIINQRAASKEPAASPGAADEPAKDSESRPAA